MIPEVGKRQWKPFRIPELFLVRKGNETNMTAMATGPTPLVSARKVNNGYKTFVTSARSPYPGHCITLNNDGDGGAGLAYYQPHAMFLDSHVTALYPREAMSKLTMIFVAKCISLQEKFFGHGHSINENRIRTFAVMLPATPDGKPDYAFMEAFMREKERAILERYAAYARQAAAEPLPPCEAWKPFALTDVFSISPGVRLTKAEMVPGNTPFAGASDSNNGITAFVGNRNASLDANVLGVNYNGSVVENFYHPYETLFSDDVKRFKLKNHPGNRHIYLFLKATLLQQKRKYEYGYKFNEFHMRRQLLMLPSTAEGTPDYAFMEAYMRRKESVILGRYARRRLKKLNGRTFMRGFRTGWGNGAEVAAESAYDASS